MYIIGNLAENLAFSKWCLADFAWQNRAHHCLRFIYGRDDALRCPFLSKAKVNCFLPTGSTTLAPVGDPQKNIAANYCRYAFSLTR